MARDVAGIECLSILHRSRRGSPTHAAVQNATLPQLPSDLKLPTGKLLSSRILARLRWSTNQCFKALPCLPQTLPCARRTAA